MPAYEDLDLPQLPEPWTWVRGEMDGDPVALRIKYGWCTRVHEANACGYTDELNVSTRADPNYDRERSSRIRATIVPFPVFEAVHTAVRQWYEVDKT